MELFNDFLQNLETSFGLSYKSTKGCFNISNSGRRGDAKEFTLSYESIVSALQDIKNNMSQFSSVYDEKTWRDAASVFSDNTIKSFCGVQTKPFFETINKLLSWANNLQNADGQMKLTSETISKLLDKIDIIDCLDNESLVYDKSNTSSYTSDFSQKIYYGVPGSGKSHKIDEKTKVLPDDQKMRVVFHPEYTNADFVGQIFPVQTESGLEYPFKAGPFTCILKRALKNPGKPYCLIIEEINRGNAAAIFGDLFQLLDRGPDGWSSYGIENLDINAFIRSENERYSEKTPSTTKQIGNIEYTENTSIRLPPNLSLYATMNTSDQNVFTLDNAFQRRWNMKLVPNECTDTNQMDALITVNNHSITWKSFQETINAVIGEKSNESGLSSMEDKRLGCWFVKAEIKENESTISKEMFADKVLKYLWDDAFKFYHQEIFAGDIKNFEELHRRFLEEGFSVFSDVCRLGEKLQTVDTSTDSESSSE